MIELPRKVIEVAARASSLHFERCTKTTCATCNAAFDRAHYAVHAAVAAFPGEFIAAIERHRNPTPAAPPAPPIGDPHA